MKGGVNMLEGLQKKLNIKSALVFWVVLALAAVAALLFAVIFAQVQRNQIIILEGVETTAYVADAYADSAYANALPIMIHISGHVQNPGVYHFYEGARVWDAVEAAGGLTPDADQNAINLARVLRDEDHIIVFGIDDNMPVSAATGGMAADGRININTATSEQLQTLSGIGPAIAGNIIAHRDARGGFATIEEIMNVSGIGERIFENISESLTVN